MGKILGLDLGTNSIGWAIINDEPNEIIAMGSRIFQAGVENLGQGDKEVSKNSTRTSARGTRRQFFRKRLRKKVLLKFLSLYEMCPLTSNDLKIWNESQKFPERLLIDWLKLNPYELRAKATKEKISLLELGRVFYHLIQRRGFLSNSRKNISKDDGTIFKGLIKENKIGITQTEDSLNGNTLGSYLNSILPKENETFMVSPERVRNRYTTRKMYYNEFNAIFDVQLNFHPVLTNDFREKIGGIKETGSKKDGILFYQRPLKSQKSLVGNCYFETSKKKTPISSIEYDYFRIYQWVNTVEFNGKKLEINDREKIIKFLEVNDKIEFKKIRKQIGKESSEYKFNYKDEDKIAGTFTISKLSAKKIFGQDWFKFSDKEQEEIWHVIYFFDSVSKLKDYAIEKWNLSDEKAESISSLHLKQGYGSLSKKAISNILPFLKMGFVYDIAVALGGIKNAFGNQWDILDENQKEFVIDNTESIVRSKISGGYIKELKEMLVREFNMNNNQLNKLYHHSTVISESTLLEKLPINNEADKKILALRNPVVVTALFELRKLVNELIKLHGLPNQINIEMARDLKLSKDKRRNIRREQQRLEIENLKVIKFLEENGQRPTHDNILLYKLWKECKETCPYTGKSIPIHLLFSGEIQIEHIHPWSRSLNDSFSNKTLCFADENRLKGDKTPFEFYGQDIANWSAIKERALKLFTDSKEFPNAYQKFKRFIQQKFEDDFVSQQLNDTRYISREAKSYLSQVCKKIVVSPGQATSNLRYKWGLNSLLNDNNLKNRKDHRHHAIDALVLACTKVSYIQQLSKWNRYNRDHNLSSFPMPWSTFRLDAARETQKILVSHKKNRNVITVRNKTVKKEGNVYTNMGIAARGELHKETVYGLRTINGEEAFHTRKPLESITKENQIEKIVDNKIKEIIIKRVKALGGFDKEGKIPSNCFFESDENGKKMPKIFLPNKNGGDMVPVLKVRIKENFSGAAKLKTEVNKWVNLRNNHHVMIYKDDDGNLKEEIVPFWTAVERKKQGNIVFQLPKDGKEIVFTMQINDMFLLGIPEMDYSKINIRSNDIVQYLYRVQKLSSMDYNFIKHTSSKEENKDDIFRIRSLKNLAQLNPVKIIITLAGEIKFV